MPLNTFRTPAWCRTARRTLLVLPLLALLVACGTPTMQPEQAAAVKRVGVVSLLPAELLYEKIGITVFNNERATRPVGDVFNQAARQGAERALTQAGREIVQIVDVDVPMLARRVRSASIIFDSNAEQIEDSLRAQVLKHRLDAIVLITENIDGERGLHGIRMLFRSGIGGIRFAVAQGGFATTLVDTRIKKLAANYVGHGSRMVRPDGTEWTYRLNVDLDDATHALVLARLRQVIAEGVASDLSGMGF